jgi:tryptophan-rich sensory protein
MTRLTVKQTDILKLVVSIVVCQGAGAIGSVFTREAIPTWYATLEKPAFNPPNSLFFPVWITLYVLMAVSAFLVWRRGLGSPGVKMALVMFVVQLVLNALWSVVFFGLECPLCGVIVILVLWLAIAGTVVTFSRISRSAAALLIPYLLWVTFASILNISIWLLNP